MKDARMRFTTLQHTSLVGVFCLLLAFVVVCSLSPIEAQVLYGAMIGNVTDQNGAAITGASVTATDTSTGTVGTTITDASGIYRFGYLAPGAYTLSISAKNFKTSTTEGIIVQTNLEVRVDQQLQIGTTGETAIVTSAPPALQTDRASITFDLDSKQLQDLPTTALSSGMNNFQNAYTIVPGFDPPQEFFGESSNPGDTMGMPVNGTTESDNNTLIDGLSDIYSTLSDIIAYAPSVFAIQSVNIVTNSFDAEQGMASGAVVNVTTKSGTNLYHGKAWEYNTISSLAAKNYFLPKTTPSVPKYILNEFGANFGGPIVKRKAFFFGNWERFRRSEAVNGFSTVPTSAMLTGNFQGTGAAIYDPLTGNLNGTGRTLFPNDTIPANRISYAASQMIPLIPAPNIATAALSNNYFNSASSEYTRDTVDSRVDYIPSGKSTIFGRYSIQLTKLFDPPALGPAEGLSMDGNLIGNSNSTVQAIGIGSTYTVKPNLLLDGNFGFLRQGISTQYTEADENYGLNVLKIPGTNGTSSLEGGYPAFIMTGLSSIGNASPATPAFTHDNTYTTAGNVSWNLGRHSTRYGFAFQHYAMNLWNPEATYGARGGFTFTGGITALNGGSSPNGYNSWADFLLGLPFQLGKDIQFLSPETLRESVWAFYARDDWQLSQKLTVNYGMRYERYPLAHRDHTGLDWFNPANGNVYIGGVNGVPENDGVTVGWGNLVPRFGVAYRLNDRTVARGGFGITVNPDNFYEQIAAYPTEISATFAGSNSYEAGGSTVTGIPAAALPDVSQGVLPLPSALATHTLPQNFRRGYIESYNVAVQREIGLGFTWQVAYVGTHNVREIMDTYINAAPPGGGTAGEPLNQKFGLTSPSIADEIPRGDGHYNSLQTVLSRRLKDAGTLGVNYVFGKSISNYVASSDSPPIVEYQPDYYRNRGVSVFDRKHNFEAYWDYNLPFGSGYTLLHDGIAGKIVGGWTLGGVLSRVSGTPFTVLASATSLNAPGNSQFANQLVPRVQILGGHSSTEPYFNPSDFAPVTTATFGTAPYDDVRGPGYFNLNTALFRTFSFTERFKVQMRGEAFNLTNTPTFANPGNNVSSATFSSSGAITSYNGYSIISSASNQRTLRFSAIFDF